MRPSMTTERPGFVQSIASTSAKPVGLKRFGDEYNFVEQPYQDFFCPITFNVQLELVAVETTSTAPGQLRESLSHVQRGTTQSNERQVNLPQEKGKGYRC